VIGDGHEREALEREAAALGLGDHIEFLGYVPSERLEEHLRNASAVVMPSLAGEVFGLVAAENMSRGKLVIVSEVGALKEVTADTGLSFPPGDSRALAACLRRVVTEPDLAKAMGERARERARRLFREEQMVAQHLAIYRQLLSERTASSEAHGSVVRAAVRRTK
jgi:glycosyltransferase involved in cell wall biosynthesis